jgi:hypothetical protein
MSNLLTASSRFLKRNSSTILTCLGAVGVVATTVMAVKATPKATAALEAKKEEKGEDLTALETIVAVTPSYAPTVITGIATIGCIFGANVLNKRNQASLMSAYALLDKSYKQHKDKVKELFGEQGEFQVKESIAKDHYDEQKPALKGDSELFYDFYSGRYFESTMSAVKEAEYELNRMINVDGGAYLNDFYELLGLGAIEGGDIVGWSVGLCFEQYWQPWIDFSHEITTIDSDSTQYSDMECCIITFMQDPVPNFEDY